MCEREKEREEEGEHGKGHPQDAEKFSQPGPSSSTWAGLRITEPDFIVFSLKKEGNLDTCYNTDGL